VYQRILVPIDGSTTADRGLHEAIRLATELKAKLRVLHVLDNFPIEAEWASAQSFEEILDRLRRESDELLASARGAATAAGVPVQTRRFERRPVDGGRCHSRGSGEQPLRSHRDGHTWTPRHEPAGDGQHGRSGGPAQHGADADGPSSRLKRGRSEGTT